MKTEFIYISDLHIDENSDIFSKIDAIVSSLNYFNDIGDILILVGGDIANKGKSKEYSLAAKFFGKLVSTIKSRLNIHARILIVPGNHDLDFNGKERTRSEAISLIKNFETNKQVERSRFNNFLWLAKINHCDFKNIEYHSQEILTCGIKLKVNLLNSALFSLLTTSDTDEGIHLLSENTLSCISDSSNCDYAITMMHHAPEFLEQSCKEKFLSALQESTNIFLYGHEHTNRATSYESSGNFVNWIRSGRFSDSTRLDSEFIIFECDWAEAYCYVNLLKWNNSLKIYEKNKIHDFSLRKQKFTAPFAQWLETGSEYLVNSITDYFEFPQLSIKVDDEHFSSKDVDNFDSFQKECCGKNIIEISGGDSLGKTTLLKFIAKHFFVDKTVLFVRCEDTNNMRFSKVLEDAYCEQYSDNKSAYSKFCLLAKSKKAIILDNLHLLSKINREVFVKDLLSKFDVVIYSIGDEKSYNVIQEIHEYIEDQQLPIVRFKIQPFYKEKRLPLLKKVCKCLEPIRDDRAINDIVLNIEKFIGDQLKYFSLTPEYLIMYAKTYLLHFSDGGTENPLRSVYDTNICYSIKKVGDGLKVDDVMQILQLLAYHIHFNKCSQVTQSEFTTIVETFNENQRMKYSPMKVLAALLNARILKENADKILFSNKSYLAYFVAKRLNILINCGDDRWEKDLKYIADNLCANINADILLFFTYITENSNALGIILQKEMEYVKDLQEFSLLDKGFAQMLLVDTTEQLSLPTSKDKNDYLRRVSNSERQITEIEQQKLSTIDIYSEEGISEFSKKQRNLLKYLEIISKILPSFQHILNKKQQDAIVNEIFSLPNKIIFFMLDTFRGNVEDIIVEIEKLTKDKDLHGFRNRNEIKNTLSKVFQSWILTIWDSCAKWATDNRSINALDTMKDMASNINYQIQNVMMYENLRKFDDYIRKSDEIYDNKKVLPLAKHFLRIIFKKHCLTMDIKYYGKYQKYIDKYGLSSKKLIGLRTNYTKKD